MPDPKEDLKAKLLAEVFERIGAQRVPSSNIWRQNQRYGVCVQAAAPQRAVAAERPVVSEASATSVRQKGLSMDGGMVHIRDEGWKEFKVAALFRRVNAMRLTTLL